MTVSLLTADATVLLLVDFQVGTIGWVGSTTPVPSGPGMTRSSPPPCGRPASPPC